MLTGRLFGLIQQRQDIVAYDIRQASRVKTFERVEGARLTGEIDPDRLNGTNASVLAEVELRTTSRNRTFTYATRTTANPDGSFSMTVPYPTDNSVAPEDGGTDSGVTATGNYSVRVSDSPFASFQGQYISFGRTLASGTADVPESAIYDGAEVTVDLNETVTYEPGSLNATLGNSTVENGSTTDLSVTAGFSNGTTRTVTGASTLASNDTTVATIDDNGTVTANGTGVARLNASFRGDTVSTVLTVENASDSGNTASLAPRPEHESGTVGSAAVAHVGFLALSDPDRAGT
jgi:hypothetical protein